MVTDRLHLMPATTALCDAEAHGAAAVGQALGAVVPESWPPTAEGVVEIGYAIAVEYQRQGFATEAVRALLTGAFAEPHVRVVVATP